MAEKILIAYESATGTTKEIASIMTDKFEASGRMVTMLPINQIRDVDGFDLIVIGAPINGMQYVPAGKSFIKDHEDTLADSQVHVFYTSYLIKAGRTFWKKKIHRGMEKLTEPIKPTGVVGFGGRVDQPFPKVARWIFGVAPNTPADVTDFDEVRSFVDDLIGSL